MMLNCWTTLMILLVSTETVAMANSWEFAPKFKTHERHPDSLQPVQSLYNMTSSCDLDIVTSEDGHNSSKPDIDLGTLTSDCNFDDVNSDYDLDILNSDHDLDTVSSDSDIVIVLGSNTDAIQDSGLIQDIDLEGTSDLDIENIHDEQTETDVNKYTEQMNSRDPPQHTNSHTVIEDIAKYPGTGLFHTHEEIDRINMEKNTFTEGDNDNCCPTVTRFRQADMTMVNTRNQIKTMAKLSNTTQTYPYVEDCNPGKRHGRRGRCKKCEPQYVVLFLVVEPDSGHTERYFDKFSIPMYCTCKSLICK